MILILEDVREEWSTWLHRRRSFYTWRDRFASFSLFSCYELIITWWRSPLSSFLYLLLLLLPSLFIRKGEREREREKGVSHGQRSREPPPPPPSHRDCPAQLSLSKHFMAPPFHSLKPCRQKECVVHRSIYRTLLMMD